MKSCCSPFLYVTVRPVHLAFEDARAAYGHRMLQWHWKSKSMAGTKTHFHSDRNSTPDLRPFAGEWVVLRDDVVIEHGTDLKAIVDKARAKGIERPRVLFVEGRDPETVRLGL